MDLGRLGVWYAADKLNPAQWKQFLNAIEEMGYGTLWYSESRGFESMSLASFMLCQTQRLNIGSSIANIYARDPFASLAAMRTLSQISGGRFVLGLGVWIAVFTKLVVVFRKIVNGGLLLLATCTS